MGCRTHGLGRPGQGGLGDPVNRKIWLVFAVILVLGVTAFFVVRSAEDKVTEDMLSHTGQFTIPADWKLSAPSGSCSSARTRAPVSRVAGRPEKSSRTTMSQPCSRVLGSK